MHIHTYSRTAHPKARIDLILFFNMAFVTFFFSFYVFRKINGHTQCPSITTRQASSSQIYIEILRLYILYMFYSDVLLFFLLLFILP